MFLLPEKRKDSPHDVKLARARTTNSNVRLGDPSGGRAHNQ